MYIKSPKCVCPLTLVYGLINFIVVCIRDEYSYIYNNLFWYTFRIHIGYCELCDARVLSPKGAEEQKHRQVTIRIIISQIYFCLSYLVLYHIFIIISRIYYNSRIYYYFSYLLLSLVFIIISRIYYYLSYLFLFLVFIVISRI